MLIGLLKSKDAPFSVLEESFVMGVSNSQHHITIMNVEGWNEDLIQKVNVLATDGLPRLKRRIKTFCKDRNIPCLVFELGYIRRSRSSHSNSRGYYQLGWNEIGSIPLCNHSSDRWEQHEIELLNGGEGEYHLVCGQKFGDSQHRMCHFEMVNWAEEKIRELQRTSKFPIRFRPHPKSRFECGKTQDPSTITIEDAMKQAKGIVLHNSTAGVQAVIQGNPFVCFRKAHYYCVSHQDISTLDLAEPATIEERLGYLSRLAYGQWNLDEFRSGEALDFALRNQHEFSC